MATQQNFMKKNNIKNRKLLMQKYLYDNNLKKIKDNLDEAYKNIDKLWLDQLDLKNVRYNYITGDILSSFLNYKKKLNVLDVGCGYGAYPNYLNKFKNINAQGIDTSKYVINVGKRKFKFKNIDYGNINNLTKKFDIKFDVITIIGVFWFMFENFKRCCQNLKMITKKNCIIYFQINIPKDNNIFEKKIKNYSDLYNFLNKFFIISDYIYYENKTKVNRSLINNNDSCIIKCKLR